MKGVSAAELLDVWEQGLHQPPIQRALSLLTIAYPNIPFEQLSTLTIGQRDSLLLNVREGLFGPQMASVVPCPACGEQLELNFAVADIRVAPERAPTSQLVVRMDDYQVQFRLPNSLDLSLVVGQTNATSARQQLLERCVLSAQQGDRVLFPQELPAAVLAAVVAEMAAADPQADVQLALACPACSHQWQSTFDVVAFLWSELHAWARQLLREVHRLAATYSWQENDILAMSSQRRQLYLEMINE